MPGPTPDLTSQGFQGRPGISVFLTRLLQQILMPSALVHHPHFTDGEAELRKGEFLAKVTQHCIHEAGVETQGLDSLPSASL